MTNIAMKFGSEVFHDIFRPATSFTCPKANNVFTDDTQGTRQHEVIQLARI